MALLRVGAYIDGFNLYYGGKAACGAGTEGWRWLDIRKLVSSRLPTYWQKAEVARIVYCTARVSGVDNSSAPMDQDRYLRALELHNSVDLIEYGNFVVRIRTSPLAVWRSKNRRAEVVRSSWPVMVKDANRADVPSARFVVSHMHREEKGSDVNLATHLLKDMMEERIDAAVVVSNDSDLKLPISLARTRIPIGILSPGTRRLAGNLTFKSTEGVGAHWHAGITDSDFRMHQLPESIGRIRRPADW